jgi:hypothetical protein
MSFFSCLSRAEIGIHHHVAGPYLSAYAGEMAWREDNRALAMASLPCDDQRCPYAPGVTAVESILAVVPLIGLINVKISSSG